jgi:hypothetical protein
MTRDQVIFVLVEVLVLAASGLVVLGWKYLVRRAESAGAEPSARALEEVRANLARLTQASSLYMQRQHEVYTEVYRHLRLAQDELLRVSGDPVLIHDIRGFTADEIDELLKESGWRAPARRDVVVLWNEKTQTQALTMIKTRSPLVFYEGGMESLRKATNRYLGNRLYFSDEGIEALETATYAFRRYGDAIEHGHKRVKPEELAKMEAAMKQSLEAVYGLLRNELRHPGVTSSTSG